MVICRIALPLAAFSLVSLSYAGPMLFTDSSWKVIGTDPGTMDAFTSLAFDDSAWENATELYPTSSLVSGVPGYGIWTSVGRYSSTQTTIWGRRTFNLSSVPASAPTVVGDDDDGEWYLNGVHVVSDHTGTAGNFYFDAAPYLHTGDNLISFTIWDNWQVWGYNHSVWMLMSNPVPEPATMSLLGIPALALLRRARRPR